MMKVGRPSLSEKTSKKVSFRLSQEEFDLFDKKVESEGLTKSDVLRELVKSWIGNEK